MRFGIRLTNVLPAGARKLKLTARSIPIAHPIRARALLQESNERLSHVYTNS